MGPIAQMGESRQRRRTIRLTPLPSSAASTRQALFVVCLSAAEAPFWHTACGASASYCLMGRGGREWGARTLARWRSESRTTQPPKEPGVLPRRQTSGALAQTRHRPALGVGIARARTPPIRATRRERQVCSPAFGLLTPIKARPTQGGARQAPHPPRQAGIPAVATVCPVRVVSSITVQTMRSLERPCQPLRRQQTLAVIQERPARGGARRSVPLRVTRPTRSQQSPPRTMGRPGQGAAVSPQRGPCAPKIGRW